MTFDPLDFDDLTAARLLEFRDLSIEYGSYTSSPLGYTFEVTEPTHAFDFKCWPILLRVSTAPTYPAFPPSFKVQSFNEEGEDNLDTSMGHGFSKLKKAELEARLHLIANEKRGDTFLRDLIEEVRIFAQDLSDDPNAGQDDEEEDAAEEPVQSDVQHWVDRQLISGIELLDAKAAQGYMGKTTLQSIVDGLPETLRLLHAEVVLRAPLVRRFNEAREKLIQKYAEQARRRGGSRRAQDAAVDKLTQIDIVFHGTRRRHVGGIVQSGFVVPGKMNAAGEMVKIRCGATWGIGTYTSPQLTYCLGYSDTTVAAPKLTPGQKIIVCAALMGRRYQMKSGENSEFRRNPDVASGYDSHVSPSKLEYVIFNPEHLLPLYVLHLEDSSESNRSWNTPAPTINSATGRPDLSSNLVGASADISLMARRKLLTAQARKHFPYGFGAASGSKFVVEEIAPVDDDEEEWGEYQEDRLETLLEEHGVVGEFQKMRLGVF